MSVFGAMNTGVSGLKGFGNALNHISENISNVTTIGYKRIETRFSTLVTNSTPRLHSAGGATTVPSYRINSQGLQEQSDVATHMSITGSGMFVVSDEVNTSPLVSFGRNLYYTRAGDYGVDEDGYLKNGAGYFLQGWQLDTATGQVLNTSQLTPMRVTDIVDAPVATTTIDYVSNVPSSAAAAAEADIDGTNGFTSPSNVSSTAGSYDSIFGPSQILFYDTLGGEHTMSMYWTKVPNTAGYGLAFDDGVQAPAVNPNKWLLTMIPDPGGAVTLRHSGEAVGATRSEIELGVEFDDDGTIIDTWSHTGANLYGAGAGGTWNQLNSAGFDVVVDYPVTGTLPTNPQTITIDLGTIGASSGSTTQWNEPDLSIRNFQQDGVPAGAVENLSIDSDGFVQLAFDNGTTKPFYKIPVASFANFDGLQLTDGNAYTVTSLSGDAFYTDAGTNGMGTFTSNNLEKSNVDLADEFTKMIIVQRAYSANARVVTIADELLTEATRLGQ